MNVMKEGVVALCMDRREMLARTGALLGTVSLGGCLSRYDDVPVGDGETTERSTPTLASRSFRMTDAGCGQQTSEATVEFRRETPTVAVTGTIPGPNTCHEASLGDASYDPEEGTLDVTVVTAAREGSDGCAQCIVELDYEATFQFDGGLPATVTVTHESMGETETVATTES